MDYAVEDEATILAETHDDPMDRNDMENVMFSLINNLPAGERELLLLKYSKGESIEALQYIFHLSASAIKMRLKRSKEKLNQLYLNVQTVGLAEAMSA